MYPWTINMGAWECSVGQWDVGMAASHRVSHAEARNCCTLADATLDLGNDVEL